MFFIVLFFVVIVHGGYFTVLEHCQNTNCTQGEYRGGHTKQNDCDPNTFQTNCHENTSPSASYTTLCLNSLDEITFDHVRLNLYFNGDTACSGSTKTNWIIRLGLCENNWHFTCNSTHMLMQKYNANTCDDTVIDSNIYPLNTCLQSGDTMYGTPAYITCHTI